MKISDISDKELVTLEGTSETPEIEFNATNGTIKFAGRSLPENPRVFYEPIKQWLIRYALKPAPATHVKFSFDYFNTASSKLILELIDVIKTAEKNNSKIVFEWHYQEDDEDMMEAGEDFESMTDSEFTFIPYP
ncbi:MAG: DUF1987 domain-containing protein [Bacteroidales bacterium]